MEVKPVVVITTAFRENHSCIAKTVMDTAANQMIQTQEKHLALLKYKAAVKMTILQRFLQQKFRYQTIHLRSAVS
jgi:outer membrane phospholipase A